MEEDFGYTDKPHLGTKGMNGKQKNAVVDGAGKICPVPTLSLSSSDQSQEDQIQNTTSNSRNSNNGSLVSDKLSNMLKHTKLGGLSKVSPQQTQSSSESASQSQPNEKSTIPTPMARQERSPSTSSEAEKITLPQRFVVKYLGYRETSNLWGIKYTRRPVDEMVTEAKKNLTVSPENALPLLQLQVTEDGIFVGPMPQNTNPKFPHGKFAIETISYGVQDLVYTRVFAMIIVKPDSKDVKLVASSTESSTGLPLAETAGMASSSDGNNTSLPFRCHAFVCDSRQTARQLTYALASAFQKFSQSIKTGKIKVATPRKFAVDLRSPEAIEADLLDSEA